MQPYAVQNADADHRTTCKRRPSAVLVKTQEPLVNSPLTFLVTLMKPLSFFVLTSRNSSREAIDATGDAVEIRTAGDISAAGSRWMSEDDAGVMSVLGSWEGRLGSGVDLLARLLSVNEVAALSSKRRAEGVSRRGGRNVEGVSGTSVPTEEPAAVGSTLSPSFQGGSACAMNAGSVLSRRRLLEDGRSSTRGCCFCFGGGGRESAGVLAGAAEVGFAEEAWTTSSLP